MLGEIRLGFFVEGIGYYKDCSKLIYRVDSSSDLSGFKEGRIIEVDSDLYKVQSVELGFIPYPGRKGCEREKPIKIVYVSRAKVELLSDKKKDAALDVREAPELRGISAESMIIDDRNYGPADFEGDFPERVEKPKKRKRTRRIKPVPSKEPEPPTPKKVKPKAKRSRTVKSAPKAGKVTPKVAKEAVKKVKAKKAVPQKVKESTRRKRCPKCKSLFKNLGRHKCKK